MQHLWDITDVKAFMRGAASATATAYRAALFLRKIVFAALIVLVLLLLCLNG